MDVPLGAIGGSAGAGMVRLRDELLGFDQKRALLDSEGRDNKKEKLWVVLSIV